MKTLTAEDKQTVKAIWGPEFLAQENKKSPPKSSIMISENLVLNGDHFVPKGSYFRVKKQS
jgi:hypothetical protein